MNKKIGMISLGCPKNQLDSENMLHLLAEAGYATTADAGEADVLIVNTCGFLKSAKEEAIEAILDMAEVKAQSGARLIVTGCLAERYADALLADIPEIDALLGVTHFHKIVEAAEAPGRYTACGDIDARTPECGRELLTPPWTAYLKIAEGCDNKCSYCAIPAIRGKFRSRPKEEILREARELVARGVREIILVAQDTTRYGLDLYGRAMLAGLMEELCQIDGLIWLRTLYCYPEMVDDQLLDVIARNEKICPYLDIPIQHIDSGVLNLMHRRSTEEQIRALCTRAAQNERPVLLRTTVIVGFPQEDEAAFEKLLAFTKEGHFARLGAFAYSREEDTPAYDMPGQIPERTKQSRLRKVMRAQQAVSLQFNQSRIGTEETVLIESSAEPGLYVGRSRLEALDIDGCVRVHSAEPLTPGQFYPVRITAADNYDVEGEVIL